MKFIKKVASVAMLLCVSSVAQEYEGAQRIDERSCESRCYLGCGESLNCGAFDVQFQGGFDPIIWKNRGYISAIECMGGTPTSSAIFPLFRIPKAHSLYRYPWVVGAQVGYALSDCIRIYGEFNYLQARAKGTLSYPVIGDVDTFNFTSLSKYRLYDAHVGLRCYSDRWYGRTAFFFGGKVGLVRHQAVNYAASIATVATPAVTSPLFGINTYHFFNSNTAVSGGLNAGLDICLGCNFAFVITGEMVASCGPSTNSSLFLTNTITTAAPYNYLLAGRIGTELRFPITAGIRYIF